MNVIYFDNAATSWPKPQEMIRAMSAFNESIGANPGRSGHRLSIEAGRVVFDAREKIAYILGVENPLEIAFAKNATEAINTALFGILKPGDHVITSGMEHNSVMRPLRAMEKNGVSLSITGCSWTGLVSPDDIRPFIKNSTKLIIITHASNVTGSIMPVKEISSLAHKYDLLFFMDAAQTAGSVPIDVNDINADALIFTGHKSLYGPQGTGGIYIRKSLEGKIDPLMRGGTGSRSEFEEQPEFIPDKYESGTPNTIGLAGLSAGAEYILKLGIEKIRKKEQELTEAFIDGLNQIKNAIVYGSNDFSNRTAVVSFNINGMSPSDVSFALDERFSIMSRPGLHCAPAAHKTINTFPGGTVRFSFGIFNTIEEINTALEAISILSEEANK